MSRKLVCILSAIFFAISPFISIAAPKTESKAVTPTRNPRSIELNEKGVAALNANDPVLAEDYFRQAVAADKQNLTAILNLAVAYIGNKKERAAITLLEDVMKDIDNDPALFARLGEAYFSSGKAAEAAKNYSKAFQLEPTYPKAAARLGALYTLMNKNSEAVGYFEKAIELDPKDAETLNNLAAAYLGLGKTSDAVRVAKKALQVKVSSDAYVTLGSAYELMNDNPNALIAFERAILLGDSRPELAKKIELLKENS